jgi:hypothetical protein
MGFFKRLFCGKKRNADSQITPSLSEEKSEMHYYIYFEVEDNNNFMIEEDGTLRRTRKEVYGPFTLSELKENYQILDIKEDTLITTDTLNGEWYEARCFECFDNLFASQQDFRINEFGEIVRNKKK